MRARVAFELKKDLHEKLEKLCKRSSLGYSEYIRGLITEEYNRVFSKQEKVEDIKSDNDINDIIELLRKIERNTRKD
jgi:hypothetical protein